MPKWLTMDAPESDVVVSTRMRLARNLADVPFPACLHDREEIERVHEGAKESILKSSAFEYMRLSETDVLKKRALAERHIISPELARRRDGALIVNEDESISVMILEEDHYRLQTLSAGLTPDKAYGEVDLLDKMLADGVEYAFDEQLGFLTSCPTNAGTGLRASVMLHLPGLAATKGMPRVSAMVAKVGMTVRGAFGEGTAAAGALYQISNQVTLGVGEQEILDRLTTTAKTVNEFERGTRTELAKSLGVALEDRVWRAVGLLKNARRMGGAEAQRLISDVALGLSLGIAGGLSSSEMYKLMMDTRPAIIAEMHGKLSPSQRDVKRAEMIRDVLTQRCTG